MWYYVTGAEWARRRRDLRQAQILREEMLHTAQRWISDFEDKLHVTPESSVRLPPLQAPHAYYLDRLDSLEQQVRQLQQPR